MIDKYGIEGNIMKAKTVYIETEMNTHFQVGVVYQHFFNIYCKKDRELPTIQLSNDLFIVETEGYWH
jgi:hypothetical protein